MPSFADVNWLAVAVAAIVHFGLGAVWYGPLFGKRWAEGMAMTTENPSVPPMVFVVNYIIAFLLVLGIATVGGGNTMADAVMATVWLWLAFVVTTQGTAALWDTRPRFLLAINAGYMLVGMILATVVLQLWP